MRTCGALVMASLLLVGLPLVGVWLTGQPVAPYLVFPPLTRAMVPASFAWGVFSGFVLLIVGSLVPFVRCVIRARPPRVMTVRRGRFPWWGWGGVGLGVVAWALAWTRLPWFTPWQPYTFTPLWVAYLLVVNAWTVQRTGRCALQEQPGRFLALFPVSAVFWWYFEYLNRFVHNWAYVGITFTSAWHYVWYATLPFSTVLPAVYSTYALLQSFPGLAAGLEAALPLRMRQPKRLGALVLGLGSVGLVSVSLWPQYCYPLVWMAPVLILCAWQALLGLPTIFAPVQQGDWRAIWLWALAALVCGVFWEMWNVYSLAKWVYAVPFVHRWQVFEMPLLGYGGYLPFGLECATLATLITPQARAR